MSLSYPPIVSHKARPCPTCLSQAGSCHLYTRAHGPYYITSSTVATPLPPPSQPTVSDSQDQSQWGSMDELTPTHGHRAGQG